MEQSKLTENFIQNEENFSEKNFYPLSSENEKSDQNAELEQTYLMSESGST